MPSGDKEGILQCGCPVPTHSSATNRNSSAKQLLMKVMKENPRVSNPKVVQLELIQKQGNLGPEWNMPESK
jgi:hypothetical protein